MDRLVTVTGSGRATAAPDQVNIDGSISGRCRGYSEAVERSARGASELRDAIGRAGFDPDLLKTTGLSVSAAYSRSKDGRTVFDGFSYSHGVRITVGLADEGLGRLLEALLSCESAPQFRVSYSVADPSAARAEARRSAVEDARGRAEELADAAGLRLGRIVSISYVSGPCAVATPRLRALNADMAEGIVPEDAEFTDSVTVEWEIADRWDPGA